VQDKESVDPTRVGGPTNHLLSDGGLSLVIGDATKGTGNAALTQAIRRAQDRGGNPDRGLLVAFGHIGRLCTALGLVKSIQDRACEVFKKFSESKSIRGRGLAAVCAAVVYIACRRGPARLCDGAVLQHPHRYTTFAALSKHVYCARLACTFKTLKDFCMCSRHCAECGMYDPVCASFSTMTGQCSFCQGT